MFLYASPAKARQANSLRMLLITATAKRKVTQCSQCIDGPALFSDDNIICTDCSKHRHLWVLILLFQLIMVSLMCLASHMHENFATVEKK